MKWWYEPEEEMKVYKNEDLCIECKREFFSKPYDHRDAVPGQIGYCVHCDNCLIKDKEKKMEFQRERCFTALNADELHEGDMVIVANNLRDLKEFVQGCSLPVPLDEIIGERWTGRFRVEGDSYALAYLVEREMNCTNCGMKSECKDADIENPELHNCLMWEKPKTEKHYRPFKDTDELIKVWHEKGGKWQKRELTMPLIWVREKGCEQSADLITCYGSKGITVRGKGMYFDTLFTMFEFLDGSPCGVEE